MAASLASSEIDGKNYDDDDDDYYQCIIISKCKFLKMEVQNS